jgi:ankyrin repeat protein
MRKKILIFITALVALLTLVACLLAPSGPWLLVAIDRDDVAEVARLLRAGGDPHATSQGRSALERAIWTNDGRMVSLLAEHVDIDQATEHGLTPLMIASPHLNSFNALLDAGADPNKTTMIGGGTALTRVILDQSPVDSVIRLIQSGADLNCVGFDEHTPLQTAALFGTLSSLQVLIESGAAFGPKEQWWALYYAVCAERTDKVAYLLQRGVDPNLKGGEAGLTVFQSFLAAKEKLEALKLLLDAGADFRTALQNGRTPLQIARSVSNWELADVITTRIEKTHGKTK